MPETSDNFLYKINYKIENDATAKTLEIYAKFADLATKAKQLDIEGCGSVSQLVYFDKNGVPQAGYDLNDTQPVKYSYDSTTKIATITFSNWQN